MENEQEKALKTEIRQLSHRHKIQLAQILGRNDNWKKLFGVIPKNLIDIGSKNDGFVRKYEVNMAKDIEVEARKQGIPVAMVLFDEWGTSGQNRPTVEHLYKLLDKIPLYWASDYIAEKILKIPLPERPPNGPGHKIDISLPTPSIDIDRIDGMLDGQPTPGTSDMKRNSVPGNNQDNPILNDSLKKTNVIHRMTSLTDTEPEANDLRKGIVDQTQGINGHIECIDEPLELDWTDIPQCVLNSVKLNDNALERIDSANSSKSIQNSYFSSVNWNVPACVMDPSTTESYKSDPPDDVVDAT